MPFNPKKLCRNCKHWELSVAKEPCHECFDRNINEAQHRPLWEPQDKKKKEVK